MEFGDIVVFRNLVFKNNDGTHEIDPYFYKGRPCVFVGEYNDEMYFLPLTKLDYSRNKKFFDIIIKPDRYNKLKKISKINYTSIIKKPSAFYKTEGTVNNKIIYEILKKSLILYNAESFDYSDIVSKMMANYVINNNIILVEKKSKNDNIKKSKLSIGDITLLKQIIFSSNTSPSVDHAFNVGRPCVFIGEYKEKLYFFPLSSYKNDLKKYQILIEPDQKNDVRKTGVLNISEILELDNDSFQKRGYIGYKNVLYMIKNYIKYYYNNYENLQENKKYQIVFNILNDEILSKNNENYKKMIKK